jgi:hypothetical protein
LNQFHTHSTHLFNILVNIIPVQMCLRWISFTFMFSE